MKRVLLVILLLVLFAVPPAGAAPAGGTDAPAATSVFINEIHYDNTSTDAGEAIEIAAPSGTDLTGWTIVLYNGNNGASYDTDALGAVAGTCGSYDLYVVSYASNGIQNGAPDGMALVNASSTVIQFLSYEGTFAATNGAASGMTSTDIGVSEAGTAAAGSSLQLAGTGALDSDFTWQTEAASTFGACNTGQTFGTVVDTPPTVLSTTPADGATNVSVTANPDVTFSEPVTIANINSFFDIWCDGSALHYTGTGSGSGTGYTITPATALPTNDTCHAKILAAEVVDQDGASDQMAADYTWRFTTDTPPAVLSTTPASDATDVAPGSNISVNFNEPVTANMSSFFDIFCVVSGMPTLLPATASGGPTSFTIDPTADLPDNTACTVTIRAAGVVDQDVPVASMAADYPWRFTTATADPCSQTYTPTYAIQGSAATPAITGAVTTQGVVVGDYEVPTSGTGQLRGFYIQDLAGDGNPATSDGLFVFSPGADSVSVGQLVRVAGTASDYQDQTQVSSVTSLIQCGTTGGVTPVDVALPLASATALEPFEGMLVRFPQTLYVTEHFQLARFGQVVMSSGGRLAQPTNVVAPGADALAMQAANHLNRIIVDDDTNVENPDPIKFGRGGNPLSASNTLRGADTATGLVGVLTYTYSGNSVSGNAYRLRPIGALNGAVNFAAANDRPPAPAAAGRLRVTAANLLNYFNTFTGCTGGVSGAAMDCRGAGNQEEFDRQWPKTVANLVGGGADVIAIMEMENDGYGSTSAIQHLVDKLNAKADTGTYAFINPDTTAGTNSLGTDAIKVGLIYKPGKVTPVGTTAALNTDDFVNGGDSTARNRPALAQAFEENSTGKRFIVVANHLKSKGSACDAPDAGDGQGNCNAVRTNAANALTAWLAGNPTDTGDPDILIMGDLNAYAKEDPITAIKNAGYTNLPESLIGPSAYSYVFDGQWGYLDHALGTASLTAQVAGIVEWHINADEPSALDYNTDYKSATQINILYDDDQFRAGDHDPVIVGLNLTSSKAVILLPLIMSDR